MRTIRSKSRRTDKIALVPLTLEHLIGARSVVGALPLRVITHLLIVVLATTLALTGVFGQTTGGLATFSVQRAMGSPSIFVQPKTRIQDDVLVKTPELVTTFVNRPRQGLTTHTVRDGETVASIADNYGISTNTVLWANDLGDDDIIVPGRVLLVLPVSGILHKVQTSETVEEVAWKYQSDVRAIVEFNQLTDPGNLAVNDVLVVPGGRQEERPRAVLAARGEQRATAQEAPAPRNEAIRPTTYQVAPGDSLGAIAQKFGISQDTIIAANNLGDNPDLIAPGQKLTILPVSGALYTVEVGDSVRGIASRYGVEPDDIVKTNALANANVVAIGQKLVIPGARVAASIQAAAVTPTYVVQPGDSVRAIAERFNVNPARIIAANSIRDADVVMPGQNLVIPGGQAPANTSVARAPSSSSSGVAGAAKPAPQPAPIPPPANPGPGWNIVAVASKYLGYPYRWGGTSPSTGFDCSGFVWYSYRTAGVPVPRDLWGQLQAGPRVRQANLLPGDIVFFENTYTVGLSHNGIYIGGGRFIHAASEREGVRVSSLSENYWAARYYGASRPW